MSNIEFAQPFFLWLFLLLPVFFMWYKKYRLKQIIPMKMSNTEGVAMPMTWRIKGRKTLPILRGVAFCCAVVAMARPQLLQKEDIIEGEGVDIMLSMDISTSMLAQDFDPNRLEAAKKVAQTFIDKRLYDRIGLIVFSGQAFTQCPLTTDHTLLKNLIEPIQNGIILGGTAIGSGLVAAVNRLYKSPSPSKVIVLMTDGKNEGESTFSTDDGILMAQNYGIKIYTIGIGTMGEALVPIKSNGDGGYIFGYGPVVIDEELLQHISHNTGGKYYRATNNQELEQIYAEIDRLEKSKIEVTTLKKRVEAFGFWVGTSLLLLICELILNHTLFRTLP